MNLTHNAAGKLSGAEVLVDDNFLLSLASGLLGGGSLFEQLVGRKTAESMIMMTKLQYAKNPKFTMGSKEFAMTLNWDGENLSSQVISGNASVILDTNDLNMISMFIDIPEEYMGLIHLHLRHQLQPLLLQLGRDFLAQEPVAQQRLDDDQRRLGGHLCFDYGADDKSVRVSPQRLCRIRIPI